MLNVVVDLSHHNAHVDFAALKAGDTVGVFHKATQGAHYTDPLYASRRADALAHGLRWGAYHFGTGAPVSEQIARFLAVAVRSPAPAQRELLVLDFEPNPTGESMTVQDAAAFVAGVHRATGSMPGLYCDAAHAPAIARDAAFADCWLWIAAYRATAPTAHDIGRVFTFWQYTDGVHGNEPRTAPGVGPCDRNMFNGSSEGLARLWGGA